MKTKRSDLLLHDAQVLRRAAYVLDQSAPIFLQEGYNILVATDNLREMAAKLEARYEKLSAATKQVFDQVPDEPLPRHTANLLSDYIWPRDALSAWEAGGAFFEAGIVAIRRTLADLQDLVENGYDSLALCTIAGKPLVILMLQDELEIVKIFPEPTKCP